MAITSLLFALINPANSRISGCVCAASAASTSAEGKALRCNRKAVARRIRAQCAARVEDLRRRSGITPGLAVIFMGDDPASHLYVGNKVKACASVGIKSQAYRYDRDVDTATVLAKIHELN